MTFRAADLRLVEVADAETFTVRGDLFETKRPHPAADDLDHHPGPLDPDETYSENGGSGLTA